MKEIRDQLEAVLTMCERADQCIDLLSEDTDLRTMIARVEEAKALQSNLGNAIADGRRVLREFDLATHELERPRAPRSIRSTELSVFCKDVLFMAKQRGLSWKEGKAAMAAASAVMEHVERRRCITDAGIDEISHGAIASALNGGTQ